MTTENGSILAEPLLDAEQVAGLLGIPRSTIYELVRGGQLPCVRIGRHIRFIRADLELRLAEQRPAASPAARD